MFVTVFLFSLMMVLLISESIGIHRSAGKLQNKIHVNGTRGKSTVTKYIHTVLQNSNYKVLGKITGEIPTFLLPDNSKKVIKRLGAARVQEQFKSIRKAKKLGADAMVMECMSIDPALQRLESKFFRPDIYIITNIRDDHREKMGANLDLQIKSICSAIPKNSKVISINSPYMDIIKEETKSRKSLFVEATKLSDLEISKLPKIVYKSNLELALTACMELGISRQEAFDSILNLINETETPVFQLAHEKHKQFFLNAFSVNDIESANDFINYWVSQLNISGERTIIFNTRSDRPLRTKLFADWIKLNQSVINKVIITGSHHWKAKQLLVKMNLDISLFYLKKKYNHRLKESIVDISGNSELIVGIGNIKDIGHTIINEFSVAS